MDFQQTSDFSGQPATPRVVAPISSATDLSALRTLVAADGHVDADGQDRLDALCDVLELRADAFPDEALDEIESLLAACPLPVLLTVRCPEEGGVVGRDLVARERVFDRLAPLAAMIDVEIRELDRLPAVLERAAAEGRAIVASAHDFQGCPEDAVLASWIEDAADARAAVCKIAATPRSFPELLRLASLLARPAPLPLAVMGMGEHGLISRLLCAAGGSVLNYGYLASPNAPGQWPAAELKALIRRLRDRPASEAGSASDANGNFTVQR